MSRTMVHTGIIPTAIWSGAWECHHSGVVSLTLSALGDLLVMCTGTVYTCVHATDKTY